MTYPPVRQLETYRTEAAELRRLRSDLRRARPARPIAAPPTNPIELP